MKCDESADELPVTNTESFLQLSCFISQDVKYLHTGLKLRLEERLTKNSSSLSRDAVYTKTSRISRLPAYMCVQLVRFYYKEKEKVSAKVLKDVKFPLVLDVFELCTDDLQKKLVPIRECFRVQEEEQNLARKAKKLEEIKGTQADKKTDKQEDAVTTYVPYSFENDLGSNNSGYYELIAVLTHKGRSSNSGHYVGWAKNEKTNKWYMYDDEDVSPVSEEEILKLSGGGDWHTAYVNKSYTLSFC
jgi:ubiquitin carboxyl-terminal hydrolase 14